MAGRKNEKTERTMHWGHKIAIVYTLFAGSLIAVLIYSTTFKHELVTEDYYQKEIHYQERIDAKQNLLDAPFTINTRAAGGKVLVSIDGLADGTGIVGRVELYKPDNQAYDQSMELVLTEGHRMVIEPKMPRGRYRVNVSMEVDGKAYLSERQVVL